MSKVSEFELRSERGEREIRVVASDARHVQASPDPRDLPDDMREALLRWLGVWPA